MTKQVKLKGRPVNERTAKAIIHRARQAKSIRDCPYRHGYVNWSIWVTAYKHKKFTGSQIYQALIKAGVPCNVNPGDQHD